MTVLGIILIMLGARTMLDEDNEVYQTVSGVLVFLIGLIVLLMGSTTWLDGALRW